MHDLADQPADLDVVVLGGGGHVGLPLSLALADGGMRVGIFDTNQATLDQLADGDMPFMESGAPELLQRLLPTGRLVFGADPTMIGRSDRLIVVIGTPVDEFLAPSLTIFDKAAPGLPTDKPKGTIELIQVGPNGSLGRIINTTSSTSPIRVGDQVYSSSWDPKRGFLGAA